MRSETQSQGPDPVENPRSFGRDDPLPSRPPKVPVSLQEPIRTNIFKRYIYIHIYISSLWKHKAHNVHRHKCLAFTAKEVVFKSNFKSCKFGVCVSSSTSNRTLDSDRLQLERWPGHHTRGLSVSAAAPPPEKPIKRFLTYYVWGKQGGLPQTVTSPGCLPLASAVFRVC